MPRLDPKILADLKQDGLLREGHFAYRSGRHSGVLLDRDRLLTNPVAASHMGYALAKRFFTDHIATIAAPSIWGAGLAQWVAYFLDPKAKVVYATPKDGVPTISENVVDLIRGERVLLVDNLIISGETMHLFDATIERLGGEVIGLGTLWNSSDRQIAGHDVVGLLNTLYDAYPAPDCPFCAAGSTPTPVGY
jgi:orotate phosphoribosyltransferase